MSNKSTKDGGPVFLKSIRSLVQSVTGARSKQFDSKSESLNDCGAELPPLSEGTPELQEEQQTEMEVGKETETGTETETETVIEDPAPTPNSSRRRTAKYAHSKIKAVSSEHRGWTTEDVQDNYFKGKSVVMTGDLKLLGERDPVAGLLKSLGARVISSVSNKTQVMIIGEKPGPSKLEKAELLRAEGIDIYLMGELELILKLHDAGVDLLNFVRQSLVDTDTLS